MESNQKFIGIIYELTSPSGHSYVGQTIQSFDKRTRQHELDALSGRNHCKALCNAIRKYGMINFKKEVLWEFECESKESLASLLDQAEQEHIQLFNTLHPNGYNMHTGGSFNGAGTVYTDEIRDNYSLAKRKKHAPNNFLLPRNVLYIKEGDREGFRLNIQDKPRYMFVDQNLTLEEKYCLVMQKRKEILDGTDQGRKTHAFTDIPKYISYHEGRDCFIVNKPGFPRKQFRSTKFTSNEKLQLAKEYLCSLGTI
jgi:group I intron endonuclease